MLKNGYKINPGDRAIAKKILLSHFAIPHIDIVLSKGYLIDLFLGNPYSNHSTLNYLRSKGLKIDYKPPPPCQHRETLESLIFEE